MNFRWSSWLKSPAALGVALGVAALGACPPSRAQIINPIYQVTSQDLIWTNIGLAPGGNVATNTTGRYRTLTAGDVYTDEVWERPVEDNEWFDVAGGIRTNRGRYYAYGDLKSASWGVTSNFFFVSITVVSNFFHQPGNTPDFGAGYKGHYYVYFGTNADGGRGYNLALTEGNKAAEGTNFVVESGDGAFLYRDTDGDVGGPYTNISANGLAITYTNSPVANEKNLTSYETELKPDVNGFTIFARRQGNTIEMAMTLTNFAGTGLNSNYFANLQFMRVGVAVSNPSSGLTDVFANDEYPFAKGNGVEYDTIKMGTEIPEPGAFAAFALATGAVAALRRRKRA